MARMCCMQTISFCPRLEGLELSLVKQIGSGSHLFLCRSGFKRQISWSQFLTQTVILYVSVYIPCDIFATTIIRIIITCVGRNSDVHFYVLIYSFFVFYHDCIFINFYSNAVHKFPVYGTIKLYCIVLYCIVLYWSTFLGHFWNRW